MTALTDRQRALLRVIAEHSGPFRFGVRDCATLAADVVGAIRGARPVEFTWASDEDAIAEIERRGGLHAAVTEVLGPAYDPQLEQPEDGDVVLVQLRDFEMLAVWARNSPIGPASQGLHRLDAKHAIAAWRV